MIDPDANEARVRFAADIEIVLGHFLEHDADVEFRHDPAVDAGQRLRDALLVVSGEGIDRVIDFPKRHGLSSLIKEGGRSRRLCVEEQRRVLHEKVGVLEMGAVPRVRIEDELRVRDMLRERVRVDRRSEEHTSELQSLMRSSYAVLCLKKKT